MIHPEYIHVWMGRKNWEGTSGSQRVATLSQSFPSVAALRIA